MTDNYQIDLNAVKNNKLFKKFMQNKSFVPQHEVDEVNKQKDFNNYQKKIVQTNQTIQISQKNEEIKYQRGIISNRILIDQNKKIQIVQPTSMTTKPSRIIHQNQFQIQQQTTGNMHKGKQAQISYQTQKQRQNNQKPVRRQRTRQFMNNKNLQQISNKNNYLKQRKTDQNFQQFNNVNKPEDFQIKRRQQEKKQTQRVKTHNYNLKYEQESVQHQNYKQKYDKLQLRYQQLKLLTQNQNKQIKKKLNSWEEEIQIYKEKLFLVQSRQDSLLIENQRLKQKVQTEILNKTKIEQDNKEILFKIQEMQDMLQMKQAALKKKSDEAIYWKNQQEIYKQEYNIIKMNLQAKNDQLTMSQSQCQLLTKQKNNKDYILEDLRNKISKLVDQNGQAKDQLFSLVSKLYHLEQQNQTLKADLKRGNYSLNQNYFNSQIDSISSQLRQEKTSQNKSKQQNIIKNQSIYSNQRNLQGQQRRRRGQFARQRAITNKNEKQYQKQQVNNLNISLDNNKQKNLNARQMRQRSDIRQIKHNEIRQNKSNIRQGNDRSKPELKINSVLKRIQQVNGQLQKIRDMKAMNGPIRRKKIQLQRQMEQLQSKMRQIN